MEVVRQNQLQIMSDSLEKLYDNGTLSDITIKCKDGGFVRAHKAILMSLSETFHELIVGTQTDPQILDFPVIRQPVLKIIIRFIYCGKVIPELPDNIELVKEVLEASFFFRLTTLFDCCKKIILGYLQNESVIQLWSVLEPFNQEDGEAEVANFILGHLEEVSCTNDFSQLTKEQMRKLADHVDKNQFNDDFVKFCVDWANSDPSYTSARLTELSILIRKIGVDTLTDSLLQKLFEEPWILQLPELSTLAIGRIMKMRNNPKVTNIHFYSLNSNQAQTFNNDVKKWNKMINRPESMDIFNSKSATICSGGKFIYRKFQDTKGSDAVLRYDTAENEADKIFTKIDLKSGPIVGFGTNIYMWSPTEFVRCDPDNQTVTKLANKFPNFEPANQGKAFLRAARDELFLRFEGFDRIFSYNIQKNEWTCKANHDVLKLCTSDSFCCGKWYFFPSEESYVVGYDPQRNEWMEVPFPEGENKRLIGQSLDLPFLIFQEEANEIGNLQTSDESPAIWLYYAEKSGRKWEKLPNGLVLDGRMLRCDVTVG